MISAAGVRCAAGRTGVFLGLLAGAFLSAGAAFAASEPMVTGGLTSQPIGHYDFCRLNPRECSIKQRDTGPEQMTGALWRKMVAVNVATNAAIKPMNDIDIYGRDEVWTYPANGEGDCEDYVLEKRRTLSQEGVSLANLLITVVRKPDGEGHAVLTVRTSKGDFVLDNLTDTVRQWDETGYRYLKRQSSENTGRWVSIREGQESMVGSVK
ncbi:transglutaminase-like cysteine peptidase [Aminobacter aganoensis]|uniref:Putative transglutaminase-like cysteine proteinase n=1 Tax=Aminobacter aganoensis TaxID=83264 RepID=A0A7X0F974_9HYPH|nr:MULTISPECIES: transglutaminase-like cysteine peptidase [Aminobacter]KQU62735.1 transglutaminase [Aminobacter sp. DSM 101952]MBB6355385.1 putative transglutaminase-like cysteine proteinase [Aminobacter aganoensis]